MLAEYGRCRHLLAQRLAGDHGRAIVTASIHGAGRVVLFCNRFRFPVQFQAAVIADGLSPVAYEIRENCQKPEAA
jgi:hypothetical protein